MKLELVICTNLAFTNWGTTLWWLSGRLPSIRDDHPISWQVRGKFSVWRTHSTYMYIHTSRRTYVLPYYVYIYACPPYIYIYLYLYPRRNHWGPNHCAVHGWLDHQVFFSPGIPCFFTPRRPKVFPCSTQRLSRPKKTPEIIPTLW